MGLAAKKNALRQQLLAARDATTDRSAASEAVCRRLATLPELANAKVILGYAATVHEVSVDAALQALIGRGVTVCVPWVQGEMLGVGVVGDLTELAPGWREVREPPAAGREPLRPSLLDVVIAPGLGFDRAGNRLGHGGGHFDRLLSRLRRGATVIGVALDVQVVDDVPAEEHDRPVDVIVTPTRTIRV
jgi:5-formyltetrahydrofolate cyclo-ligase